MLQRQAPPERSFWELVPKRNFRRVLFLVAILFAVVLLKRAGGGSLWTLLDAFSGPAAPAAAAPPSDVGTFHHIEVVPRTATAGDQHP